ncbi:hypothetical protein [Acetobacterium woodii]|uniref:Uncharacterized protein n=1 Tax=Acetobacterium woodii (strain ATCC 29683 / DSM 1030 / JCM 2381 / KCTC 1655 / WB1) TaxID=931626 RepID=H6LCR4_ACEWD|nr:hypothetical protein [Acetobacterium woodii]AFA49051.1 hypothetical protein Awo_c22780 [Acetobacterium woodii DSM 1030]
MYQEEFLPVVFNVQFTSAQALPVERWRSRIEEVLHVYIDQILKDEERLIGHIKALAQINETDFIKYSCISDANGINSNFQGKYQEVSKISMIVNSLVSNISESESRIYWERSCKILKKRDSDISIQIEKKDNPLEGHHHHHENDEECPICNGHHHH